MCLDKYNTAKSQNSPVLQIALKFADNDKIKAGQYLKNFENILNYPDDEIDYFDENIMQIVVNKCCSDNASSLSDPKKIQTMTEYLCRYENYNELSDDEQNTLSEFIKLFNENDEIDKAVMKYLVSEKYINNDTNLIFKNNSAEIPVIFAKEAKTEIFKHYKYPKCIDYLTAFEFAMTKTTSYNTGASGIKQLTPNSENRKLEVKIAFDKDRLYSSNNDYRFDIYDSYGYHD